MKHDKSLLLISGDTHNWTDGTQVRLSWTYEFLGSRAGSYHASQVRVLVHPARPVPLQAVDIYLLERQPRSGEIASDIRRRLTPTAAGYAAEFEWNSTVNVPEQELYVTLTTGEPDAPVVMLKDPISRRFNFLLSFAGE